MKLVHLSIASIIGCLIGLIILLGAAVHSLDRMQDKQAAIDAILDLQARINNFSAASDSLLLFQADPELWRAVQTDARALQTRLQQFDEAHSDALKAVRHINHILATIAAVRREFEASAESSQGNADPGPLSITPRSRVIMNQVAGHGIALDSALDNVLRERRQVIASEGSWILGSFAGAAVLFGALCVIAFGLIYRRVAAPAHKLSHTLEEIMSGNLDTRAAVRGDDELAHLAQTLNYMLDHRQRVEAELREQQAELERQQRMLVESQRIAHVGSWRLDIMENRVEWSMETYRIMGLADETFTPTLEGFFAAVHPDDLDCLWAEYMEALQGERFRDIEVRIFRPDGELRHVYLRAETEFSETGRAVRLEGTIQDITTRKIDQLELKRLKDRLTNILESITDAFYTLDHQWRFDYVNNEAVRLMERPRAELIGKNVWTEFPEAVGTSIERAFRRALSEHVTVALEEYYPPLGRWFDIRAYPSEEGLSVYFVDVSERHAMMEQLDHILSTRQALINSLPAHIALLDGEGTILDVNKQWRHFGRENAYTGADFGVGVNYLAICDNATGDCAEEAQAMAQGLRDVLDGQRKRFTLEYPCHSPDQYRWFRVMVNRLTVDRMRREDVGEAVVMHIDITERKLAEQELNRLAYEDPLTGLLSRNGFVRTLSERIENRERQSEALMVMLDIKGQRDINDVHGYETGNALLIEFARRLNRQAGEQSLAGRIGGDEFVLFLLLQGGEEPEQRLATLNETFKEPFNLESSNIEITVYAGYTHLQNKTRTVEDLLREAELALFRHRSQPDLPWVAYTNELDDEAHQRIRLTRELREALARNQFELHFQPKVDLKNGKLLSCETLLRWNHPERGLQSPAVFIPIAEQSQLIGPIGDWVLREACRWLRAWRDEGLEIVRVAVNVSLVQFQVGDLVAKVREALAEFDVEPAGLTLEITESVFERESELLLEQIRALSKMGVRLSLDDFGTGYSSLLYLQKYPFDEIKIDQGFVCRLLDDPYSRNIVGTVMSLAGALSAEVVAEGIETAEIRDELLKMGCRSGQGFFYSMPLAAEDFRWLLEKRSQLPLAGGGSA